MYALTTLYLECRSRVRGARAAPRPGDDNSQTLSTCKRPPKNEIAHSLMDNIRNHKTQKTTHRIQNTEHGIQNTKTKKTQNAKLHAKHKTQNTNSKHKTQKTKHNSKHKTQNNGTQTQNTTNKLKSKNRHARPSVDNEFRGACQ